MTESIDPYPDPYPDFGPIIVEPCNSLPPDWVSPGEIVVLWNRDLLKLPPGTLPTLDDENWLSSGPAGQWS